MPQEHHVLRCAFCETFQVHIVKKTNKWECKICKSKQSIKRNYGRGSGKDCRNQVMKLNKLRILKQSPFKPIEDDENFEEVLTEKPIEDVENFEEVLTEKPIEDDVNFEEVFAEKPTEKEPAEKKPFSSKWTKYLDESNDNTGTESEEDSAPYCLSDTFGKKKTRNITKRKTEGFKNNKVSFEGFPETSNLFSSVKKETFETSKEKDRENDKKCFVESQTGKDIYKNFHSEHNRIFKQSKYAKYLDEDEDCAIETEINKNSNIFTSDLFDTDDILNF